MTVLYDRTNSGPRQFAYWHYTVSCNVLNRTTDDQQKYADYVNQVAFLCWEGHLRGERIGVWHSCSIVSQTLDRCPCYPCSKAPGERSFALHGRV